MCRVAVSAAASRVSAEARVTTRSRVSSTGSWIRRSLRTSSRTAIEPETSTPVPQTSPSPMAACRSPAANSAPSWATGRYTTVPAPMRRVSRLPPCTPGVAVDTGAPAGATPMTPIMGWSGTAMPSAIVAIPSSIGTILCRCSGRSSLKTPKPWATAMMPWRPMSTDSMRTLRTSPGWAPSTKTGPVAGFTRSQSMVSSTSPWACTWSSKQSAVSNRTLVPARTDRAGSASPLKAKTRLSLPRTITSEDRSRRRPGSVAVDLAAPRSPRRRP